MGLISRVGAGLIAGLSAEWVTPAPGPGGIVATAIIGTTGVSVGGFVARILGGSTATGFDIWSVPVATPAVLILLALYRMLTRRTARGGTGDASRRLVGLRRANVRRDHTLFYV